MIVRVVVDEGKPQETLGHTIRVSVAVIARNDPRRWVVLFEVSDRRVQRLKREERLFVRAYALDRSWSLECLRQRPLAFACVAPAFFDARRKNQREHQNTQNRLSVQEAAGGPFVVSEFDGTLDAIHERSDAQARCPPLVHVVRGREGAEPQRRRQTRCDPKGVGRLSARPQDEPARGDSDSHEVPVQGNGHALAVEIQFEKVLAELHDRGQWTDTRANLIDIERLRKNDRLQVPVVQCSARRQQRERDCDDARRRTQKRELGCERARRADPLLQASQRQVHAHTNCEQHSHGRIESPAQSAAHTRPHQPSEAAAFSKAAHADRCCRLEEEHLRVRRDHHTVSVKRRQHQPEDDRHHTENGSQQVPAQQIQQRYGERRRAC